MNFEEFVNSLNDEQKKAMMTAFGVDPNIVKSKPDAEPKQLPSKTTVVTEDFRVVRDDNVNKGKTPVKFRKNEWEDDGEEFMDVKTPRIERMQRQRDKAKKVEVECHMCGRTFSVNPKFVFGDYHRCNRCTRR